MEAKLKRDRSENPRKRSKLETYQNKDSERPRRRRRVNSAEDIQTPQSGTPSGNHEESEGRPKQKKQREEGPKTNAESEQLDPEVPIEEKKIDEKK